ncbi:MAG: N-acetylmuramoyl-L-alanine amidase [Lachnospiraceae bacterium]|nr:N-acetylmuramoyl-L-alanine amidase [Lachnospiraceae bacterium]
MKHLYQKQVLRFVLAALLVIGLLGSTGMNVEVRAAEAKRSENKKISLHSAGTKAETRPDEKNGENAGENIVVVIDPGHGGSNLGAQYLGVSEREINIITAEALVEELSKYEGVTIYLTHSSYEDEMSLKKRAQYASKVEADYLFSLHYNASGNHYFYGAETWVQSSGHYYSQMYAFSQILMEGYENYGLYNRGIKTKLGAEGDEYYGILRECKKLEIPAVILEHCHLDHPQDQKYVNETAYKHFGYIDATAIAKFLHLSSEELGVDYSGYSYELPQEPVENLPNDETGPSCHLDLLAVLSEEETTRNQAMKETFRVTASDEECRILYYSYSLDGGKTFTQLKTWEEGAEYMDFSLSKSEISGNGIQVAVYNEYNMDAFSDILWMDEYANLDQVEEPTLEPTAGFIEWETSEAEDEELYLYIIVGACILLMILAILAMAWKCSNDKVKEFAKKRELILAKEAKVEEAKVEDTKAEETKSEETKSEETKSEESVDEQSEAKDQSKETPLENTTVS